MSLDILICIVPKIIPRAPTVGPAVLKSHLQEAGFTAEVVDLNISLYREAEKKGDAELFYEHDIVFKERDYDKLDETFGQTYEKYKYVFDRWINLFKAKKPKYIGLSLLTYMSSATALKLSSLIRKEMPTTKIIWGGAEVSRSRGRYVKELGLLDYYISGDAEESLVSLLQGNTYAPGINENGPTQLADLDVVLTPNYDDINWNNYSSIDKQGFKNPVYVTGSRGCVKRCDFCNVFEMWPKYTFRSGEKIAEEMIALNKKYNRQTFVFTDSLINGSLKSFRNLLTILADYNSKRKPEDMIRWHSQWIVRDKKHSPEKDFELMKLSGCIGLDLGIESFSERIRYEMGKKFTQDDMWWCFEMLHKFGIQYTLMGFVGYPTETDEDHFITIDSIEKFNELGYTYIGNRKVVHWSFSNVLMMDETTPLWPKYKDKLDYMHNEFDWKYKNNTLDVRLDRLLEVNTLIEKYFGQKQTWMVKKKIQDIQRSKKVQKNA